MIGIPLALVLSPRGKEKQRKGSFLNFHSWSSGQVSHHLSQSPRAKPALRGSTAARSVHCALCSGCRTVHKPMLATLNETIEEVLGRDNGSPGCLPAAFLHSDNWIGSDWDERLDGEPQRDCRERARTRNSQALLPAVSQPKPTVTVRRILPLSEDGKHEKTSLRWSKRRGWGRSLTATRNCLGETSEMTQFLKFGWERRVNVSHKTRDVKSSRSKTDQAVDNKGLSQKACTCKGGPRVRTSLSRVFNILLGFCGIRGSVR